MSRIAEIVSPVHLLNAAAAAEPARRRTGIAFDSTGRLALDVYAPMRPGPSLLPVVVFFYGGGWESGSRTMYRFVGSALAARGLVTVIADYRVYPEVRFPGFLDDAAQAVAWTRANVEGFGGDPSRIVLAGHSAGAHIAAMLALDRQWLDAVGLDTDSTVKALVGLAGPYDFLPLHSEVLRQIFGPEPGLAATQPINFVDRPVGPVLLATGTADRVVDPANSSRLAQRIRSVGGRAALATYPRVGHEALIGAMALPLRLLAPVLGDMVAFVRANVGLADTERRGEPA